MSSGPIPERLFPWRPTAKSGLQATTISSTSLVTALWHAGLAEITRRFSIGDAPRSKMPRVYRRIRCSSMPMETMAGSGITPPKTTARMMTFICRVRPEVIMAGRSRPFSIEPQVCPASSLEHGCPIARHLPASIGAPRVTHRLPSLLPTGVLSTSVPTAARRRLHTALTRSSR